MDESMRLAGIERMRAYVAIVQPLLRLSQWEIYVQFQYPSREGALAESDTVRGRWVATIRFGDGHFLDAPQDQRNTVIHELLHVVTANERRVVWESYECPLPGDKSIAWKAYDFEQEMVMDHLATVLAPFLPLPPSMPSAS